MKILQENNGESKLIFAAKMAPISPSKPNILHMNLVVVLQDNSGNSAKEYLQCHGKVAYLPMMSTGPAAGSSCQA